MDEDEILEHLATEETPDFLGLFRSPWTDRRTLDTYALQRDLQRIERYYRARGFYDARVETSQVVPVDEDEIDPTDGLPEEVDIEIRVAEGRPVRVRSVVLEGTENLDPRFVWSLRRIDRLSVGDRFDEQDYDSQKVALTNALLDAGYARGAVDGGARVDPPRYTADVVYTLRPGVLCTMGEIRIEGLDKVDEERVQAALYIEEGQRYSASELVQAQRDIYDLGVFSTVDVRPDLDAPGSVIPIVITLQESDMARFRAGFGAQNSSQEFEVHGILGWEHRNLGSDLQRLDIENKPAYLLRPSLLNPRELRFKDRLEVNFRWPGLVERRTSLLHTGTYSFGPPPGRDFLYDVHDVRLVQGFDRPITRWLTGALLYHFDFAISTEPRDAGIVFDDFVTSWIEESLVADFRDSILLTRRGALLSLSVGEKPDFVIGRADFYRLVGEARGFLPLVGPLHLATRLRAGRLFVASTSSFEDLPQTLLNDFTSGGPNSNRGYPFRSIRPKTCIASCETFGLLGEDGDGEPLDQSKSLVGGLVLWEASLELRLEIAGPFRLIAFMDASDAFLPVEGFDFGRHHLSVGPGFRWDSILGAIRADVGFRLPTETRLVRGGIPTPTVAEDVRPRNVFGYEGNFEISLGIGDAF